MAPMASFQRLRARFKAYRELGAPRAHLGRIAREMHMGEIGHKPERRYIEARKALERLGR